MYGTAPVMDHIVSLPLSQSNNLQNAISVLSLMSAVHPSFQLTVMANKCHSSTVSSYIANFLCQKADLEAKRQACGGHTRAWPLPRALCTCSHFLLK